MTAHTHKLSAWLLTLTYGCGIQLGAATHDNVLLQRAKSRAAILASSGCTDQADNCSPWADLGYCSSSSEHYQYMEQNCCASCGGRSGGGSASSSGGSTCGGDQSSDCSSWASSGYCSSSSEHYQYMLQNCCASCGSGTGGGSASPTSTPSSTPSTNTGDSTGGGSTSSGTCVALSANAEKEDALNIVLVPSAFGGNLDRYRQKVQAIYSEFAQFEPFDAASINGLNVWYVNAEASSDNGGLCQFGCYNTARLLCCDGRQSLIDHARSHCGSGFVMNVLIVHNDDTYGGAGFPGDGAASVSTNSLSAMIGIHELGHSLFGLGDEYTIGAGNPSEDPNCDNSGCSKWRDLIDEGMATCSAGKCQGGSYSADSTNMMFNYDVRSFGAVNQRITCCKYVYHTGVAPGYCSRFESVGVGLTQYCDGQLWQGRYTNLNLLQTGHFQAAPNSTKKNATKYMLEMAKDTQGDEYAFVQKPVKWILERQSSKGADEGDWVCNRAQETLQSGLYLAGHVMGDYNSTSFSGRHRRHRDGSSSASFVKVEVAYRSVHKIARTLFFDTTEVIEVPRDDHGHSDTDSVLESRRMIEIVLDEGEECHVRRNAKSGAFLAKSS